MMNPSTMILVRIGIPDEEFVTDAVILPGWKQKISRWFTLENNKADYIYDFGDNWEHALKLEKILLREKNIDYYVLLEQEIARLKTVAVLEDMRISWKS